MDPVTQEAFLKFTPPFGMPSRIFGDVDARAKRILYTWNDRGHATTGILLSGLKGGGKTLLAKKIANDCVQDGIPSIMVNEAFCANSLSAFLGDIEEKAVVIFDEFEKIYKEEKGHQERMLSMFDGVQQPKSKLFILTCNNLCNISHFLLNRPGRVLYHMPYDNLSRHEIWEYCDANLNDKSFKELITQLPLLIRGFSYDILGKLIEEMNRFNESPFQALQYLNVNVYEDSASFTGVLTDKEGKQYDCFDNYGDKVFNHMRPLIREFKVIYRKSSAEKKSRTSEVSFKPTDFYGMTDGNIIMKNKYGQLKLTPYEPVRLNAWDTIAQNIRN